MSQQTTVADDTLVIKRTINAPVEKVYQAWADPAKLAQWFRPNTRWNASEIDNDPRPGGQHHITMHHSDGDIVHIAGQYLEVVPNERIAFTWAMTGADKTSRETRVTLEFRAVGEATHLTLTHDRQIDRENVEGTSTGWTGCLDLLEEYLAR